VKTIDSNQTLAFFSVKYVGSIFSELFRADCDFFVFETLISLLINRELNYRVDRRCC